MGEIEKELAIRTEATETQHNDFKAISGKGLKLYLDDFVLGITSDTGWYDKNDKNLYEQTHFKKEITEYFQDCHLLIPHIGSIKEKEFDWLQIADNEKERQFKR